MSARITPSTSIDSSDFSIYQEFANRPDTVDANNEVIFSVNKTKTSAPSLTSTATQTTFQKLYRWLFGQKKSYIVQEFSAALEAKYGKEVASFAFSEDKKQQALQAGLSKSMVKQAIDTARIARQAKDDIAAYVQKAEWNIAIVQQVCSEINIEELHEKFRHVKNFATCSLNEFKDVTALQAALQEAITLATTSKTIIDGLAKKEMMLRALKDSLRKAVQPAEEVREENRLSISPTTVADLNLIMTGSERHDSVTEERHSSSTTIVDEIEDIYSTCQNVADAPMTEEALQVSLNATRLQHEKVMSELREHFETNPKELEAALENLSMIAIHAIQQVASQLAVFANHIDDDPSACFHLDVQGTVIVSPASHADAASQVTTEENQKVWRLFCSTLETCYGKPLLQRLIPEEKREALFSSSLTTAHVKQFFNDIQSALEADRELLKSQPFIVDDNYCDALLANPEFSREALKVEQQATTQGTSSIQIARKLFDIGVLTAGYHAGGFVAGGMGTTVAAILGITVPVIPLTLVASVFCSWVAGRIVGARNGQEAASFAAYRAATYTIGGASVEITSQTFIDSLRKHLVRSLASMTLGPESAEAISFLTQFVLEEGGSIVADSIRHACIGSIVNGVDVAALSARPNELHPTQAADMDRRIIDLLQNIGDEISQISPPASHQEQLRTRVRL